MWQAEQREGMTVEGRGDSEEVQGVCEKNERRPMRLKGRKGGKGREAEDQVKDTAMPRRSLQGR